MPQSIGVLTYFRRRGAGTRIEDGLRRAYTPSLVKHMKIRPPLQHIPQPTRALAGLFLATALAAVTLLWLLNMFAVGWTLWLTYQAMKFPRWLGTLPRQWAAKA